MAGAEEGARTVIREQFSTEIEYKEGELRQIEERIGLTKLLLQRLRLGILAQHYGLAGFAGLDLSDEAVGEQSTWQQFEEQFLSSLDGAESLSELTSCGMSGVASQECSREPSELGEGEKDPASSPGDLVNGAVPDGGAAEVKQEPLNNSPSCSMETDASPFPLCKSVVNGNTPSVGAEAVAVSNGGSAPLSRCYMKRRIIVGNTSQYIEPLLRTSGDVSTHKWMVYVRGPSEEADVSDFVRSVRFFLHPSYHPNDIVFVCKPPFHLTRLGWGEFPVRVQLEFRDRRNKPVDIIHNLLLDRTHTGQQTLGAETVVDVDIVTNGSSTLLNGRIGNCLEESADLKRHLPTLNLRNNIELTRGCSTESGLGSETDSQPSCKKEEPEIPQEDCSEPEAPHLPPTIRHIFLPTDLPSDMILLDHDYCANVVVSYNAREPETPAEEKDDMSDINAEKQLDPKPLVLTTNLDRCLHDAVQAIPLSGRPVGDFCLTAGSLEEFKSWNVGRRRAAEWMRATTVRRLIQQKLRVSLLSTKQVMQWCRRNGYTPLDPVAGVPSFCKFCGCQVPPCEGDEGETDHDDCTGMTVGEEEEEEEGESCRSLSTLSTPFELFAELVNQHEQIEVEENRRFQEQEVDVVTVDTFHCVPEEPPPRLRVPQTPELKWVQQTAARIGISIYPAVIDRMYAHVVEHMIFMACSRFLRAILNQSVQEAGRRVDSKLSRERVLVPWHLYHAMQHLEFCDFLTSRYMGVPSTQSRNRREREE